MCICFEMLSQKFSAAMVASDINANEWMTVTENPHWLKTF